jgi:hypothetical protein
MKMTPQTATRKSQSLRDASHGSTFDAAALGASCPLLERFLAAQHTEFCWQDNVSFSQWNSKRIGARFDAYSGSRSQFPKPSAGFLFRSTKAEDRRLLIFRQEQDEGSFMSSKLQRNYSFLDKTQSQCDQTNWTNMSSVLANFRNAGLPQSNST